MGEYSVPLSRFVPDLVVAVFGMDGVGGLLTSTYHLQFVRPAGASVGLELGLRNAVIACL